MLPSGGSSGFSSYLSSDMYALTPMCDPVTGTCGEKADRPSPRTMYSARNEDQYNLWTTAHAALRRSAAEYDEKLSGGGEDSSNVDTASAGAASSSSKRRPLILLGDSITESWLGTNMGEPCDRARGVPEVFDRRFSNAYDPLILAIGGDQTQHLLYRMDHGERTKEIKRRDDAIFVVLIGTNNLGSGMLPGQAADGVRAVVEYLLRETAGRVVVQLLLPRGDGKLRLPNICPPRCSDVEKRIPFTSFLPAVGKVNKAVRQHYAEMQNLHRGRMALVDCNEPFFSTESSIGDEVNVKLMPDSLHPNVAGHELLATCLLDCIESRTCSWREQ